MKDEYLLRKSNSVTLCADFKSDWENSLLCAICCVQTTQCLHTNICPNGAFTLFISQNHELNDACLVA